MKLQGIRSGKNRKRQFFLLWSVDLKALVLKDMWMPHDFKRKLDKLNREKSGKSD